MIQWEKIDWYLAEVQKEPDKNIEFYIYKREALIDSHGIQVIPSIGFILEEVPEDIDAIMYTIHARSRMTPVEINRVFTKQSGEIK